MSIHRFLVGGFWGLVNCFWFFEAFWVGLGFWGRDAKNDGKSHGCEYRFGKKCSAFCRSIFVGHLPEHLQEHLQEHLREHLREHLPEHLPEHFAETNLANFIRIIFFLCCDLTKLLKW